MAVVKPQFRRCEWDMLFFFSAYSRFGNNRSILEGFERQDLKGAFHAEAAAIQEIAGKGEKLVELISGVE